MLVLMLLLRGTRGPTRVPRRGLCRWIGWGTGLPTDDGTAGEASFAKCVSCHTIAQGGPNGTGPNLFGVVGAHPAVHPGFSYSSAMVDHGAEAPVWTFEELGHFLEAQIGRAHV